MDMDLKHALDVENSDRYFVISEAIKKIESADDPDIMKLKLLRNEAIRIQKDFQITSEEKKTLRAFKYNADKNTWEYKDLTEAEVMNQINKAQSMYQPEKVIDNLSYLAIFYKKIYTNSKMYEPFFDYCLELCDRLLLNEKVAGNVDLKDKIDELNEELKQSEKQNEELKKSLSDTEGKVSSMKNLFAESLLDMNLLKFYSKIYQDNIRNPQLIQLITYLNAVGGETSSTDILKSVGLKKADLEALVQDYSDMLKYDAQKVSLIYDEKEIATIKEQSKQTAEKIVYTEDERERNNLLSKVKGVFFKKVKKGDDE